mgnify:CR=1 FL=1
MTLFFGKLVFQRFKEFHGLHGDIKNYMKQTNLWPLSCTEKGQTKKIDQTQPRREFRVTLLVFVWVQLYYL